MRRRSALLASCLAVGVLLVGCGGDDDSADDEDTPTTTEVTTTTEADEETTQSTEAPEETTESTEAPDDTTIEDPDDTTPDESTPPTEDLTAFCETYDAFDQTAEELPDETVEDIRTGAATLRQGLEQVGQVAPAEIAPAVDVLTGVLAQLEQIANESETVEEAEESYANAFSTEDAQNAVESIDSFFSSNCPQASD